MWSPRRLAYLVVAVVSIAALGAAAQLVTAGPAAPTGTVSAQQATPRQAERRYRQYADGLLVRLVYSSEREGPYTVQIWDLLVGPGMTAAPVTLPGAAVLDVRSGSGRATVGGEERDLPIGTTLSIDEGTELRLSNASEEAGLSVRAVIISGS